LGTQPAERRRERAIFWGYRAAERLISAAPRGVALAVAAALGNVAYDVAGRKRELVVGNLEHSLSANGDGAAASRAARRAFRNYAKYLVDVMRLSSLRAEEAAALVTIDNIEILDEARQVGPGGVLICTVHVGGADLIGPALKANGELLRVVADDTTYGRLYDHLAATRARHGIFLIGWRNLRGLYKALRAGENLVLFCDGGYREGDVPIELHGAPTTFPLGPATLAAKTGAPIVPVLVQRTDDDRFVARGLPIIRCESTEPAEIYRATQRLADELGAVIAEDPSQWYMFRPVWPVTDDDRRRAADALAKARRGEDWTRR
jgi:phosphatidylinositol dimannoside acyltransferase